MEKAWPIGVFFLVSVGSSLLTQGFVLESFGNSTSNTSKFDVLIILWFTGLVYSLCIGNRVIVHSVSVVLGVSVVHVSHPILRIKLNAKPYVCPEINHT